MKVLILAGGRGMRMMPLTSDRPKVLIEVDGRPWLSYLLEQVQKAGFTEIGIVVGYKAELIKKFLATQKIKSHIFYQSEQLGTGHATLQAREWLGNDDFILLMGDNWWTTNDIKQLEKHDRYSYVTGIQEKKPEKFGVLQLNGECLGKIIEKPREFVSNLVNTGAYKFTKDIWYYLQKVTKNEKGEYYLTDAINLLAAERKVKVLLTRTWIDLGSPNDMLQAAALLKKAG